MLRKTEVGNEIGEGMCKLTEEVSMSKGGTLAVFAPLLKFKNEQESKQERKRDLNYYQKRFMNNCEDVLSMTKVKGERRLFRDHSRCI